MEHVKWKTHVFPVNMKFEIRPNQNVSLILFVRIKRDPPASLWRMKNKLAKRTVQNLKKMKIWSSFVFVQHKKIVSIDMQACTEWKFEIFTFISILTASILLIPMKKKKSGKRKIILAPFVIIRLAVWTASRLLKRLKKSWDFAAMKLHCDAHAHRRAWIRRLRSFREAVWSFTGCRDHVVIPKSWQQHF